jgi:ubiquinone/menaquinone biosynthesis C-methylase UbiE
MTRSFLMVVALLALTAALVQAQEPVPKRLLEARARAEREAPHLIEALELRPGMIVADVGAGIGLMTVPLARWLGNGRVIATDIDEPGRRETREYARREGLTNVTVIEGAAASTNLPAACCDAIFLRRVYHQITEPAIFNRSLAAALKPGGRLAIISFIPTGTPPPPTGTVVNRGPTGVPIQTVIDEMKAAGLEHVRTIEGWPPGEPASTNFLALFRK